MTTNVDDLLERAGSVGVVHIHGSLFELVNLNDRSISTIGYKAFNYAMYPQYFKPNVVMFGEMAPLYSDLYMLLSSLTRQDLVLAIGSSEMVVQFCYEAFSRSSGTATILYVNPDEVNPYDGIVNGDFVPYTEHYCMKAVEAMSEGSPVMKRINNFMER